ncbi:MAG TPA: primary-amine oxidase [Ktedonobacteraceae bacterium]|nr:primary-amine oxidase [Ktedonobacteraceae bacterium]
MAPTTLIHPLEPLKPEEIAAAVAIVQAVSANPERLRFVMVKLHEPTDPRVATMLEASIAAPREVFLSILEKTHNEGKAYEVIVNLTERVIRSWKHIEGVQPSIMFEEFFACEETVKANPAFQAALARRGITDLSRVRIDPWSAGNYGRPEERERRILRTTVHYQIDTSDPEENTYAHPIAGLHAVLDLNTMEMVRVDDFGVVPIPQGPANYLPKDVGPLRTDLKPLEISQPQGPSFTVDGYRVRWQKWDFRIGFSPREGLILHNIYYDGRPLFRSVRLAEMVVPYGDPSPDHCFQNAFDVGEYGVGWLANSLELGCDCLGLIHYFDAYMTENDGTVRKLANAVCMHEEDDGILWKHWNYRTEHTEVRRSRRLVISFIATIGIYEYGFFWYLRQDASIEMDIKLTGIMNIGAVNPGVIPEYGELLTADGLYAPIHQHTFCFRLEPMIDGLENSVEEADTVAEERPTPYGNACKVVNRVLRTEREAQRDANPLAARSWKIINPNHANPVNGKPVGYQLLPHTHVLPFAQTDSSIMQRAGFTKHHLWVTPYHPDERYPAGDYPNQHAGGAGLPTWTATNRNVENTILTVWYNVNFQHDPRLEDWPVMPVAHAGFLLRPHNFFTCNPALDVPPPEGHQGNCHHG